MIRHRTPNGGRTPLLTAFIAIGGEQTGEDHDDIGDDGNEDIRPAQTGEEGQIEQQERGGDGPVDVADPEDLSVDMLDGVGRAFLLGVAEGDVSKRGAVARGHSEVGQGGKRGDERGDDMEQPFLLFLVSPHRDASSEACEMPYHGHGIGQGGEDDGGDQHEHEHDPIDQVSIGRRTDRLQPSVGETTDQSVRWPVSPATCMTGFVGMILGCGVTWLGLGVGIRLAVVAAATADFIASMTSPRMMKSRGTSQSLSRSYFVSIVRLAGGKKALKFRQKVLRWRR